MTYRTMTAVWRVLGIEPIILGIVLSIESIPKSSSTRHLWRPLTRLWLIPHVMRDAYKFPVGGDRKPCGIDFAPL